MQKHRKIKRYWYISIEKDLLPAKDDLKRDTEIKE